MDDDAPFPPHSQSPAPTAAGSLWLVSYADDDDRELTSEQISLALQRGEIDLDTIVWRDGMPEWQPIREVVELRSLLKRHAAANAALRKKQTVLGGFHAHDFFPDEMAPPSSAPVEHAARAPGSGPRTPLPPAAPPPRPTPAPGTATQAVAPAAPPFEPESSAELDSGLLQDIPASPDSPADQGGDDSEETLPLELYRPQQSTLSGTGESPPIPPVSDGPALGNAELSLDRPSHASLEGALESLMVDFDPDPSSGQSSRVRSAVAADGPSSGVETPRMSYPPPVPPGVIADPVLAPLPPDEPEVSVVAAPQALGSPNGDDAAPPTIDVRGRQPSTSPPATPATVESVRFEPHFPPAYADPPPPPRRGYHGLWLVALIVASAGMFTLGREMGQRQLTLEGITPPTAREATAALNAEELASERTAEAQSPSDENRTSQAFEVPASTAAASASGAPSAVPRLSNDAPSAAAPGQPRGSSPAAAPGRVRSGGGRPNSAPQARLAQSPSPKVNTAEAAPSAASPLKVPAVHGSDEAAPVPDSNRDEEPQAPTSLPEFNTSAAAAALSRAATSASACRKPGDPKGTALVSVTFSPSGDATRATVEGSPFAGTPTGSCIASKMRAAHVPPFAGSLVTVRKSVVIQ